MFCTRSRYQVSDYRTIGPLVVIIVLHINKLNLIKNDVIGHQLHPYLRFELSFKFIVSVMHQYE